MLQNGHYVDSAIYLSYTYLSYLANAAILLERPIEATRAAVIHLVSGRPAGIAYYMDNANRGYHEA